MPSPRLSNSVRLILLVTIGFFVTFSGSVRADEAIGEAAPADAVGDIDNADEPKVDLKERAPSVFRNVSRTRRARTNDRLVELCKETVEVTSRRMLSTDQHTPWQMIHALLGLRNEWSILHNGSPVSGLDWIAAGQSYENEYWFESTQYGGRAHPYSRPYAFEGHANQTIALISMCGVGLDREFGTGSGNVTMRDMIRHAQMTVSTKDEPTWTLWVLSRYLPPSAQWRNANRELWSIERLVKDQVDKPMKGAPCGGTHGLFALAHARNVYLQQGNRLRGVWLEADYKIRKYINTARFLQNRDGSLSSNYFRGREYNPDFNKRMASVGHTLEFLMIALPQKDLNQPWVRRAIESAARELMNNRKAYVKCSPLYHTVNALNIYLDRVNPAIQEQIAVRPDRKTVQAEQKTRKDGIPVQTVSQPRPVPDTEGKHKLQPVPDVSEESQSAADHSDSQGEWTATPADRRKPIDVSESKTGGTANEHDAGDSKDASPQPEANVTAEPAEPLESLPTEADSIDQTDSPKEIKESPAPQVIESGEQVPENAESSNEEDVAEMQETTASGDVITEDATPLTIPVAPSAEDDALEPETVPNQSSSPEPAEIVTDSSDLRPTPVPMSGTENATISQFVSAWESPARPAIMALPGIVSALNLQPGSAVADLGSGTGVFVKPLYDAVGQDGRVYAIETSADLVEHIEKRVETENLDGVFVVRNDASSLQLTYHRVDRILMVDTWRHLSEPAAILLSAQQALVPGGELLIVDSEGSLTEEGREQLLETAAAAGLEFADDVDIDGLATGNAIRLQRPF